LQAAMAYAAELDDAPGLLHFEGEIAHRLFNKAGGNANLFISGGVGAMRLAADRQQAIIAECARNPLCFFHGTSFRSGWHVTLSGGVGADLPITKTLILQPTLRLVQLDAPAFLGVGVGLTWRLPNLADR
jgi:hypothetical protein